MSSGMKVEGLKELDKALRKMPARVAKNAVAASLRAGGRVIVKSARDGLPSNYKNLRRSIKTKVLRQKSKYTRLASIGSSKDFAWLAHIVEYGTLGSRVKPLSPQTKRKREHNPMPMGLRPIPFMRSALTGKKSQVVAAMSSKLRARIEQEAAKLRK